MPMLEGDNGTAQLSCGFRVAGSATVSDKSHTAVANHGLNYIVVVLSISTSSAGAAIISVF